MSKRIEKRIANRQRVPDRIYYAEPERQSRRDEELEALFNIFKDLKTRWSPNSDEREDIEREINDNLAEFEELEHNHGTWDFNIEKERKNGTTYLVRVPYKRIKNLATYLQEHILDYVSDDSDSDYSPQGESKQGGGKRKTKKRKTKKRKKRKTKRRKNKINKKKRRKTRRKK